MRTSLILIFFVSTFIFGGSLLHALEGVDYVTFKIKGVEYDAPIPNKSTRDDFYHLKKVLAGDEISREILLGKSDVKWIFIGDVGVSRWIKLTKNDIEVIENKGA